MSKNIIKYFTIALSLLTVATGHAQNPQADTSIALSVYNTGVSFKLIPADFGGVLTTPLVATMIMSYDTVMVLKETGKVDTTGRKPIRYKIERLCDKMSRDIKGKIVVMELNKDCDVTNLPQCTTSRCKSLCNYPQFQFARRYQTA